MDRRASSTARRRVSSSTAEKKASLAQPWRPRHSKKTRSALRPSPRYTVRRAWQRATAPRGISKASGESIFASSRSRAPWGPKFLLAITTVEAFYFAVVTCTTVGYGDFSPAKDRDKLVCSVFLVICVVVLSNTITELFDIRLKRRIRSGKSCQPDVEQLLLAKIAHHGADPSTVACYESDYVVAALVESGVVDAELLRAIRRQYHWTAIGADGDHEDIDLADLHHKLVNDQRKAPSKRSPNALPTDFDAAAAAARGALAFTKVADAKGPVPEDFDDWFRDVWMPKVDAARAARQHLREEGEHAAAHYHVHSEDRHRHDAAADDGP